MASPRLVRKVTGTPGRGGCGIVAIAELRGGPSHAVVRDALEAIACLEHRGGRIGDTGDGAGLLLRPERAYFERFLPSGRRLEADEPLIVGTVFLLPGERNARTLQREVDVILRAEGLAPLGWRKVPTVPEELGAAARADMPRIYQLFVARGHRLEEQLPQALAACRRRIEDDLSGKVAVPALNPYTTVYKALATGEQLARFYPDLADPELTTRVALGHRRFSTNTFSNWHLVQPFRLLAHNGEINTIRANTRAIRDVQHALGVHHRVLMPSGSDSAQLDRAVELIANARAQSGLPEALRRLIPPAWRREHGVDPRARRFYEASQRVLGTLGAWEGPAAIVATDGEVLVGMVDRMGLRPLRWVELASGRLIVASEVGCVAFDPAEVVRDGQLEPGGMLLADLADPAAGALIPPEASTSWVIERADRELRFGDLSTNDLVPVPRVAPEPLPVRALNTFGWNRERLQRFQQMVKGGGKEVVHSMGNDRPLGIFSEHYPRLFSFLNQIVAVVTNPPIDPLREGQAMDLTVYLGRSPSLGRRGSYRVSPQHKLDRPVLTNEEMAALKEERQRDLRAEVLDATFADSGDHRELTRRIHALCEQAVAAVRAGEATILVVSDREATRGPRLPLPTLLVIGALHRALASAGERRNASVVVETGEVYEGHDLAVLIAYGATAVNPYAMFALAHEVKGVSPAQADQAVLDALTSSLERVMSKMGITTIEGYRGSGLFEAVAISPEVVDYYLPGTESTVGGVSLRDIYEDIAGRARSGDRLARAGDVRVYRKEVTHALQLVARNGNANGEYDALARLLDQTPPVYLRDLLDLRRAPEGTPRSEPVPADEVIRATFRAAAMSHGALHATAHRAIAAAFNELGALSNSGEGGEDERRNLGRAWEADRNRIRQVASGRFGVDALYLVGCDEIEIKIGQGAKPGEGGHLPAHKVTPDVARIRKTREGVALISPPPHHDIYSIEDLAQLIRNLRQVNPRARIGVKVPAVTNLGTICVGIAKAGADVITISGCVGGTGAAYSGSIFHAGVPLERGLAEAHQFLVANGIRDRVQLCADGGIKYGLDVVKTLALGADSVGFGTALLVAENCVFCRGCHQGNCPVGITTQDEEKQRQRWMVKHNPELKGIAVDQRYEEAKAGVVRYLRCVAEHVRTLLRELGLTHPRELVGRVDLLEQRATGNARWDRLDLSELLADLAPEAQAGPQPAAVLSSEPPLGASVAPSPLNARIVAEARAALARAPGAPVRLELTLERGAAEAVGATLAGELARGALPAEAEVELACEGFAGQGFGFAATTGMTLRLRGYANDCVGEVMGGEARVIVVPPRPTTAEAPAHLVGNAVAYGATGGALFVAGGAGQRFGVRNSGAVLVAEHVGKYAFEYMTGGLGVVLGPCGPCLGSGLTGGEVALHDPTGALATCLHPDVVTIAAPGPERRAALEALLRWFLAETGSPRASALLEDWERQASAFRWVRAKDGRDEVTPAFSVPAGRVGNETERPRRLEVIEG